METEIEKRFPPRRSRGQKGKVMIKNINEVKKDQIKAAADDFSGWQGRAVIHLNLSSGDVWTDVFSGEDFNAYHDDAIIGFYAKDALHGRDEKISVKRLTAIIELVIRRAAEADLLNEDEMGRYITLTNITEDLKYITA
jgi:hypothetical protein